MKKKINTFIDPMNVSSLNDLLCGTEDKNLYQILELYECEYTGYVKADIRTPHGKLMRKKIADIINNMELLEKFNKKTIRTLTYLAAIETTKPDYSIVSQQFGNGVDDHTLSIRSRHERRTQKKSVREIFRDKNILLKFNPIDANRIGYLAGVKETVEEFKLKPTFTQHFLEIILKTTGNEPKINLPADQYIPEIVNFVTSVIDRLPCYVYWKGLQSEYLGCNKMTADYFGFKSTTEIIGKNDFDLFQDSYLAKCYQDQDKAVFVEEKPIVQIESDLKDKYGNVANTLVSKAPLSNLSGKIIGLVGITVDVTGLTRRNN